MALLRRYWPVILLLLGGLVLIGVYFSAENTPIRPNATSEPIAAAISTEQATPLATATSAQPLVFPSPTLPSLNTPSAAPTTIATEPILAATLAPPASEPIATDPSSAIPYRERFGVGDTNRSIRAAAAAGLPFGAYLNWNLAAEPLPGIKFWQMVRVSDDGPTRGWETLAENIAAHPGATYLIGNEPDVRWQDNVAPAQYAVVYHDLYQFIKEQDPSAQVAIGGVSQATPLRRAYLDIVLDTYQSMYSEPLPVDIFNVHAFVLREESGSWGVDIPPGMDGQPGILYELDDHDDIDIFQQNISDFRDWMAERGYGDKPLLVSEYGILMPADYGFPPDSVASYLTATFDFFTTATGANGYEPDGGRLVQWWVWYSVDDPFSYPNSGLFNPETNTLTPAGQAFADYVQ